MGDQDWQSNEYERHDRLAGAKAWLARVFGDGENPLAWGFKVASFGDVPIKVHLLFIVYLLVELIFTLPGNRDGIDFVLPRLIAIVGLVTLRELVHTIAAKRAGGHAPEIMLWPFGGLIPPELPDDRPARLKISLAPIATNLALLPLLAIPLYLITHDWQSLIINPLTLRGSDAVIQFPDGTTAWWLVALGAVHSVNLIILVINLLPMHPLDGARILETLLSKDRSEYSAQWLTANIGIAAATVIGIFALVMQDATALFALCVVCGLICSFHRRRLQFLATADMIPGIPTSTFPASENNNDSKPVSNGADQAEIDRILAKISQHGIASLTRKERRTLKRATETSRQSQ
ncbi:MAG: hypothetical protein JJ916_02420 [Phycisphaerales bacterium]|nr:hypothetical protein [Phycisphaerales bacterium]